METVDRMIWGLTFCSDFGSMFVQTTTSPTRIASVSSCFAMKSRVELRGSQDHYIIKQFFCSPRLKSVSSM